MFHSLEAQRDYMRKYRKKHKDKLNALARSYYHKNPIVTQLRRKKISIDVEQKIAQHRGKCDICDGVPDGRWKKLNIDHCHTTGNFRGMLCSSCNRAIGYFKDNVDLLQKTISYLRGENVT
jgi:hypothetical protein